MSLLLDALKKSDQERRAAEIANLRNLPIDAVSTPAPRSRFRLLIGAVVMVGVGYASYAMYLDRQQRQQQTELLAEQARLDGARKRDAERRAKTAAADQAALRTETRDQQLAAMQKPTSNEALMQTLGAQSNPEVIENSETYGAKVAPAPMFNATPPAASVDLTAKTSPPPAAADTTPEPPPPEPPSPVDPAIAQSQALPRVWDLPFAMRQSLPATSVNMHVYAQDPAQRVVMVNMESGREGALLKTGLEIREITPTGAIVRYQGTEFFIGP
jgi:general secretion pathway protein B